jgi:hypothetical protein
MDKTWGQRHSAATVPDQRRAIAALVDTVSRQIKPPLPISTFVFNQMVALFQEAPIPLTGKADVEAMAAAYQKYIKENGLPLDQDFIDWGNVPEVFEYEWRKARELWFNEVSQVASKRMAGINRP